MRRSLAITIGLALCFAAGFAIAALNWWIVFAIACACSNVPPFAR